LANPQAENGHVDIAHDIIEALARYRINGQSWQCLLVVFRKTYGWKKKEDEISLSQFSEMTGLKRSNVVRAIKWLVSRKILTSITEDTTHANKYKFNKNFDTWLPSITEDTTRRVVSPKIMVGVSRAIHTKENSTKEKRLAAKKAATPPNPEVRVVLDYFRSRCEEVLHFEPVINYGKEGAIVKSRLKEFNVDGIQNAIDWFLKSEKAKDHPTLAVAMSEHSINLWQSSLANRRSP